jgi:nucleotide-binding universal stress UspA family protein
MFPPKIILAAVDFSEPSRVALMCAARLAKQCDAQLHVVHAEDPVLAMAARSTGVDLTTETRSELGAFMQSAFPAGDWIPQHHVIAGPAVEVIRDTAERETADLIVVGARGMSGVERMFFGSTTEGVLRRADTSVLVVPERWQPPRPDLADLTGTGPIVVGVEPSPPAVAAARTAATLAAILRTSVEAVHIVPPLPVPARWSHHAEHAQGILIEAAKADIAAVLHDVDGGTIPLRIETGSVPERLAEIVADTGSRHPLLVLGRRTHAERGNAPGSIAFRVLALSQAPVLMYLPDR